MASQKSSDKFIVYGLLEIYHMLGIFDLKIVLSPKHFKNSHDYDLQIFDSDGEAIKFELIKWGRKMNCKFTIDNDVSDGIASVNIVNNKGTSQGKFSFWVIK